jgi:F-type H+-transporting ATPase subunit epsilon
MRLLVANPTELVVDRQDVTSVRAEDESGSFGIREGHADFLTVLSISILLWRESDGKERYCALRRGVLTVSEGKEVNVATREAVVGEDLDELENVVLARFRETAEEEQTARAEVARLQMMAIRRILRYLRPGVVSQLSPLP